MKMTYMNLEILTFIFPHFWQLETSKSLFSIFLFSKKDIHKEELEIPLCKHEIVCLKMGKYNDYSCLQLQN
jgi:hypothetical protein